MSQHDLVSAQTSTVCITQHAALIAIVYIVYVCHFQQFPWEIGSVWAERVGQGEVGWYIQPKGENNMAVCGLAVKVPQ